MSRKPQTKHAFQCSQFPNNEKPYVRNFSFISRTFYEEKKWKITDGGADWQEKQPETLEPKKKLLFSRTFSRKREKLRQNRGDLRDEEGAEVCW